MTAVHSDMSSGVKPDFANARPKGIVTARDPRLDFFRGLAMFIIFVAHTPGNYLTLWIPARFGFSDAAEIFVFCSGMASAVAFGRSYERKGWLMGSARVVYRVWQVYWAHICMFFVLAMLLAAIDNSGLLEKSYINSLNLGHFFKDPIPNIVGIFTLTYVPNYFDILPMYLVILAMMPLVMALSRVSLVLTAATLILVWLAANRGMLQFPAEPWSERAWYFNPFGWQILFFTGFAFMIGWIPAPPVRKGLIIAAALVVLISIPFTWFRILREFPELREISVAIKPFRNKTGEGIFRYVHFLSLAYLCWVAVGPGGSRLIATGTGLASSTWRKFVGVVQKVGQQSLAVFVFSMIAARIIGMGLDVAGRSNLTVGIANLIGFVLIIFVANLVAWFKSQPWRKQ